MQPADALQSRAVDDNTSETSSTNSSGTDGGIRHYTDGGLTSDQQEIVLQHLEAWEEPADPISAPVSLTYCVVYQTVFVFDFVLSFHSSLAAYLAFCIRMDTDCSDSQ